ncbi:MAG TPA: flagellar FlbD family protein [Solirubrobacteraceae bacterium]|jgi:flagellar protein FlbD
MITLHRIGHPTEPFQLNPDSIVTVESTPDTVVTLTTACKVVVGETPQQVAEAMRAWRVDVLAEAIRSRRAERRSSPQLSYSLDLSRTEGMPLIADHRGQ